MILKNNFKNMSLCLSHIARDIAKHNKILDIENVIIVRNEAPHTPQAGFSTFS